MSHTVFVLSKHNPPISARHLGRAQTQVNTSESQNDCALASTDCPVSPWTCWALLALYARVLELAGTLLAPCLAGPPDSSRNVACSDTHSTP